MLRLVLLVLGCVYACLCLENPAWAEKRVALVIGNGAYENDANLPNPPRDAAAIASLLKAAEFDDVTISTDLGLTKMRAELREFSRRAADADIAVVFYAGHGLEVGGHNYIVPIDAKLEFDTDVEDEAVGLDHILKQLEPVKRLKLVILDACRENPFARRMRSVSRSRDIVRGLAPMGPSSGNTMVAYAAALGETAADGHGANSPFTTALLKNLTLPGLDVRLALGKTHDDVLAATGNTQEPYVYTSLGGDTLALAPALAKSVEPTFAGRTSSVEQSAFESAMRADTVAALDNFVTKYPQSSFADIAGRERDRLKSANVLITAPAPAPAPAGLSYTPPEPNEPKIGPSDIARVLQTELRRVGCDPVSVDGNWGAASQHALALFNAQTGAPFDLKVPRTETIQAVRLRTGRVCELQCGAGRREQDGQCITILCKPGEALNQSGACEIRRVTPNRPLAGKIFAPAKQHGGCIKAGGESYC